ncbi:hypothetical protein FB45DRAFT_913638 [Roridomyces roridus]|uniref:Uncharacterized protein n=1 Tax=Roridomyces roridus TaxID=1738132 RepID=A0AAD7BX74_9AGAR|nr:hypothetical protein FB45DRAFT_913638 [Roridomyces roridus]
MFQLDVCLSCGKDLQDGRAYCNDFCQNGDASSSEASSPFSSPHLAYASGTQDVPPFTLGKAHERYSTSSSSASSWSVVTDDDSEYEHGPSQALFYARRPSGTNNASIFPHLRTSSASSVCLPQSAPSSDHFLSNDDEDYASDVPLEKPVQHTMAPSAASTTKSRRKRNRASLPAYFSILTTSNTTAAARMSPVSVSSTNTFSRHSPPTPKLASAYAHTAPPSAINSHFTPRGRRNDASPHLLRSASRSCSPSPDCRRDSDEKVADWSSAMARERGRAVRRNSSSSADVSPSGSRAPTRGRARVNELDGPTSPERPGFGHGRSGLISRAKRGVMDSPTAPL